MLVGRTSTGWEKARTCSVSSSAVPPFTITGTSTPAWMTSFPAPVSTTTDRTRASGPPTVTTSLPPSVAMSRFSTVASDRLSGPTFEVKVTRLPALSTVTCSAAPLPWNSKMSTPDPPDTVVSLPSPLLQISTSLPAPPPRLSAPALPLSRSSPSSPVSWSLPALPTRTSSPASPLRMSLPLPPVTMSLPPRPKMLSSPSPPRRTSSPMPPKMTSSPSPPSMTSVVSVNSPASVLNSIVVLQHVDVEALGGADAEGHAHGGFRQQGALAAGSESEHFRGGQAVDFQRIGAELAVDDVVAVGGREGEPRSPPEAVVTRAAEHDVVADAGLDGVVAGAAADRVVAPATREDVVAVSTLDGHGLVDRGEDVVDHDDQLVVAAAGIHSNRRERAAQEGSDQRRSTADLDALIVRGEPQVDDVGGGVADDAQLVGDHGCRDRRVRLGSRAT